MKLLRINLLVIITTIFGYSAYPDTVDLNDPKLVRPPYRLRSNIPMAMPNAALSPMSVKIAYGIIGSTFQGKGQTIAIVDAFDHPAIENDLAKFNATFGLSSCTTANGCFSKIYASGTKPATNLSWAMEIALDVQWAHAIAPDAKIMLVEAFDSSYTSLLNAVRVAVMNGANVISMSWGGPEFSTETASDGWYFGFSGVTFVAASGDWGHGVIYPAASPYVLSVGGTTLKVRSNGGYLSEVAWSGSGGGVSAYEPEPAYQSDYRIPQNPSKSRGVPDVAYDADPSTGFPVYYSLSKPGWYIVGGTSAGSPQWSAIIAIANSGRTTPLGNVNSALYKLAIQKYSDSYHDIISGSNGSCGFGCTSQVGYDYVTGLGTPQANNLINYLITMVN